MSKSDNMAKLPGLRERSGVFQLRVVIPLDLRGHYGGHTKLIESLGTKDRRDAARMGAELRGKRLQKFADVRRALNPQPVAKLATNLGTVLAERVRSIAALRPVRTSNCSPVRPSPGLPRR